MRSLIAATAAGWMPLMAEAGEKHFFADVGISSALIDRGEQLAREVVEVTAGVEVDTGGAILYGAVYRLLPAGQAQEAFDDEMDYVLGAAWDGEGYSADISANWLTYPGEATMESLELSGSLSLDRSFAPTLAGFYDTRVEDWGLEISAGPEWEWRTWILYAVGRAGFVAPGDGSASRSYGGLELGAARPLSERATVGLYTRAEWADEDAFVRRTDGGSVTGTGSRGVSAGIILSLAH